MKNNDNIACSQCFLKSTSIFKNFKESDFINLFSKKKQETFSKHKTILKQGDASDGIICIREGTVKVFQTNKKKSDFIFWFAHSGDLLGIDSFINKEPLSFSAMAVEPVKTCIISKNDLETIIKKKPEVSIEMMKVLCNRIDFIEKRMVSIAQKGIKEQLAEILFLLGKKNKNQSSIVMINYSVKDLANIIGTTKNYIYKILSDFSENKILKVENRKLKITDMGKLSKIAFCN